MGTPCGVARRGSATARGATGRRDRLGVVVLLGVAFFGCHPALRLSPNDADRVLDRHTLAAPDPGQPGPLEVLTLYYGSGTDLRRPEYRDSVSIVTPAVDASKLVDLGSSADERNDYWGFTPEEMPLNARVWYPAGDGPFPLVLVVHGNHNMRDFSDPGYDYLGNLLASRGYILASVDENFINGGIRGENDARGWFLLKHIEQFERFNEESGNPFFGRVAMDRIALIGHSRGGEAVANAAAFNRLARYPDDATVVFDFEYGIRGIVSIAPVDGQYLPTGRKVVAKDLSYLTFHGSHDGDVTSFHGLRLYDRVVLGDPDEMRFKSAVYVYRANHGQWNTVWGAHDRGPRSGRSLDLRSLITPEEQRRFAEIYVSAFLEAVLKDNLDYLPIFRDHRVIGDWLPKTMYVTRFETNAFRELASFEEDIDVETGTAAGVGLRGDSLSTWKESTLTLRSSNRATTSSSQESQAVTVGWSAGGEDEDDESDGDGGPTPSEGDRSGSSGAESDPALNDGAGDGAAAATRGLPDDREARFAVELPARMAARWALGRLHSFNFSLSPTRRGRGDQSDSAAAPPLVWVEAADDAGRTARLAVADYGALRLPLDIYILRRRDRERESYANQWELTLQDYAIPLGDFLEAEPELSLRRLVELRFVFDRSEDGEVVIDRIGISELHPEFWTARYR
ncbi:MAG: hypothetical protein J4G12_08670 [Gemmatimonadetes bacterium]|nr:hypothetical protein [Gemmatimonadota bacterium]